MARGDKRVEDDKTERERERDGKKERGRNGERE